MAYWGFYRDNGKENGNCYVILGISRHIAFASALGFPVHVQHVRDLEKRLSRGTCFWALLSMLFLMYIPGAATCNYDCIQVVRLRIQTGQLLCGGCKKQKPCTLAEAQMPPNGHGI